MALDDHALAIRPSSPVATRRKPLPLIFAAGLAIVALVTSPLLPFAIVAPVALTALAGFIASELAGTRAKHALTAYAAWRARQTRQTERERALAYAGCSWAPLGALDALVASVEQSDPELARRLDLEALLDRHVSLSIAYQRALRAVMMADRAQLERVRDEQRSNPRHDPSRLELCEQRLRCQEECEAKAQALADELANVADLIRLIAQRVACPDDVPADDAIERALAELGARDAATHLISEELH